MEMDGEMGGVGRGLMRRGEGMGCWGGKVVKGFKGLMVKGGGMVIMEEVREGGDWWLPLGRGGFSGGDGREWCL